MIERDAKPIDHRPVYKRVDLARKRQNVCPSCGVEDPKSWTDHALGCEAPLAEPTF